MSFNVIRISSLIQGSSPYDWISNPRRRYLVDLLTERLILRPWGQMLNSPEFIYTTPPTKDVSPLVARR